MYKRYIIIIIILFTIKLLGYFARKIRDNKLMYIMTNTRNALNNYKIQYWLDMGTALGCYRNNKTLK